MKHRIIEMTESNGEKYYLPQARRWFQRWHHLWPMTRHGEWIEDRRHPGVFRVKEVRHRHYPFMLSFDDAATIVASHIVASESIPETSCPFPQVTNIIEVP